MIFDWRVMLGAAGVVWLGYVFAGYPILLAIVARMRRIRPAMSEDFFPTVSVLISARNEEKDIKWKVRETLEWDYPVNRLEVWVASDASEDHTDEILKSIEDPRLHFIRMDPRGGKGRALNRLVERAKGELLFFTDANSSINPACLRRMARHFADNRVGSVTGHSHSGTRTDQPPSGTIVYWRHELLIRQLENRFGSVLVCDGAIFCIRRALYVPVDPELANDLELPIRIGGAGYWLLHEPEAQVLEKDTNSPAEEFARRRRICAQGALGMWKLRKTLHGVRAWQFASHKFMRWLTLVPLILVLACTALLLGRPIFRVLFGLELLFYSAAAAGLVAAVRNGRMGRIVSVPLYILVGSVGAFAGLVDACTGRRFDIWESPSLTRGGIEAT